MYVHAHMHPDSETTVLASLYLYMYSVALPGNQTPGTKSPKNWDAELTYLWVVIELHSCIRGIRVELHSHLRTGAYLIIVDVFLH
jgi:hypothetical protein